MQAELLRIKTDDTGLDTIIDLDFERLTPAQKAYIRRLAALDALKDDAKKQLKANRIDFTDVKTAWLAGRPEATQQAYTIALTDFMAWLGERHFGLVNAIDADKYVTTLAEEGLSPNSIRAKISALSSFYSTLHRYGKIESNPFKGARLPKKTYKHTSLNTMTQNEFKTITDALERKAELTGTLNNRRAAESARTLLMAVQVMAKYGLRIGALQTVHVTGAKMTFTSKGKSYRRQIEPTDFTDARPFKGIAKITLQKGIERLTSSLAEEGKLSRQFTCHDFRHFFAAELYRRTHDVCQVRDALGHASLAVTDCYLKSLGLE